MFLELDDTMGNKENIPPSAELEKAAICEPCTGT